MFEYMITKYDQSLIVMASEVSTKEDLIGNIYQLPHRRYPLQLVNLLVQIPN
jgi:hypothetical protein